MNSPSRRAFLRDVGTGMLVAGAGPLAADLGLSTAFADDGAETLSFGGLTPLVRVMQQTPVARLQPLLVARLQRGEASLSDLIGAAALANAQTLGGSLGARRVMAVPERAFATPGPPEWQRSDNGPEFISQILKGWLAE
jgi:hypothetical protein